MCNVFVYVSLVLILELFALCVQGLRAAVYKG